MNTTSKWVLPLFTNVLPLFPCPDNGVDFIFEFDLSASRPQVDFSLCFLKSEASHLLNHWRNSTITPKFANNDLWQRLKHFVSLWQGEGTSLNTQIADIWFEFDHPQLKKELPEPCFFFSPRGLFQFPGEQARTINSQWLLDEALVVLGGKPVSAKVRENISLCLESLPAKSNVFQVGLMLSRNNPAQLIRLCTSLPIHLYIPFLQAIGWSGSVIDLKTQLRVLSRYVDSVFLDIDVGENINTPLGLECCLRKNADTELRVQELLSFLVNQELATPENVAAVHAWIHDSHVPILFARDVEDNQFRRALSHVKTVINHDNSLKTKVYLSISRKSE